jgi:hypothetical protein
MENSAKVDIYYKFPFISVLQASFQSLISQGPRTREVERKMELDS